MGCANCGNVRRLDVSGKTSDMCDVSADGNNYFGGYVPEGLNIGGGDYLSFAFCLNCGRIEGKFPITEKAVQKAFDER